MNDLGIHASQQGTTRPVANHKNVQNHQNGSDTSVNTPKSEAQTVSLSLEAVHSAKLDSLKAAIENGSYQVNSEQAAHNILRTEGELLRAYS